MTGATDVIIIGAGHSGLAMSAWLGAHGIEHVVLERGEIANSWRHERWDSLRLLTPNWQSRLPDYRYAGDDPDGFMTMPDVVQFITGYARFAGAPVRMQTAVSSVRAHADGNRDGFHVQTHQREWRCRAVVLASGANGVANVPPLAGALPAGLRRLTAKQYRNPGQLGDGGVLIVGASATGVQLANELAASGRAVTLAAGEHIRMPRTYRGRDIQWWLDAAGILDQKFDEVDDLVRARRVPSPQLVGSARRETLDLNALRARGVNVVGRLVGVEGQKLQFSGTLRNECAMADLKLTRLLGTFDALAAHSAFGAGLGAPERFAATRVAAAPRLALDVVRERIGTVIWATGYRPDFSWLQMPVFDPKGRLRHHGGVVAPGLYVLGLNFLRRRKSSFIHGAEDDVRELGLQLLTDIGAAPRRNGDSPRFLESGTVPVSPQRRLQLAQ
jgi:putative flavoprotein involved in K+ transport